MDAQQQQVFESFFSSLNPETYHNILTILHSCLVDSRGVLNLEEKIKHVYQGEATQVKDRVLLILTHIFLDQSKNHNLQWISLNIISHSHIPSQLIYIAGILLKNAIKSIMVYLVQRDQEELVLMQQAFLHIIAHTDLSFIKASKKLEKEFYSVVSALIVTVFNYESTQEPLFKQIIQVYSQQYNYHVVRIIIRVLEDGNDDRMWVFVGPILQTTLTYLGNFNDNKLLFLVWLSMQKLQWAVDADQSALEQTLNDKTLGHILSYVMQNSFNVLYYKDGQAYIDSAVLQNKRYSAKILTLIFRDFANQLQPQVQKQGINDVYNHCVKILEYFLPFYLQMVTFNPNLNDADKSFSDFEMEFQSLIVQILSLVSTLMSKKPAQILKDSKELTQPLLYIMVGYSMIGFELEKLFAEDQNLFLTAFFDDAEDDNSNLSIRSVVAEILTEALSSKHFDRKVLSDVIEQFLTNQLPPQIIETHEKKLYIGSLTNISQLNVQNDISIPSSYEIQKQEVALFILGSQTEYMVVDTNKLKHALQIVQEGGSIILRLRSLWLLEKAHESFTSNTEDAKAIFQVLSDLYVNSNEFSLLYQCLKTLHKYMRIVNVKQEYPTLYKDLLVQFIHKTYTLLAACNDETIHVPIEGLIYLSKIDEECCMRTSAEIMPGIFQLYTKYHQDGLLGEDIVELIKIWASVPENPTFLAVFFDSIYNTIKVSKTVAMSQNTSGSKEYIDTTPIKNMMSILTSYMLANGSPLMKEQDQQFKKVVEIFEMLLEILNATKDIYVCLYSILCLSAFCQALPDVARQYNQFICTVLKNIMHQTSGPGESSFLYLGHLLIVLIDNNIVDQATQEGLIDCALEKLSKAQMPSIIKSFVLPLAFCIVRFGQPILEFLASRQDSFQKALTNWLQNYQMFQGDFAKKINKLALVSLMNFTTQNLEVASLKIRMSAYSPKETDLQTRLVYILVKDLIMGTIPDGEEAKDEDDDYGDDYGDEDLEGDMKQDDKGFDFGDGDDFEEDVDLDNKDEKALMSAYVTKYKLEVPSQEHERQVLAQVGQATMGKIVSVAFDEDTLFSNKEIEVLRSLFM